VNIKKSISYAKRNVIKQDKSKQKNQFAIGQTKFLSNDFINNISRNFNNNCMGLLMTKKFSLNSAKNKSGTAC